MIKVVSVVLNNFTQDSRVLKESVSLKNAGYDVTVVALHDDGLKVRETVEGINVNRIPLRSRKLSKVKLVQFFKFVEFLFLFVKVYRGSDIIHCNDLSGLMVGFVSKLFCPSLKLVYDAHEYESNVKPNQSWVSIKLHCLFESFLIRFSESVITVSESIADEYVRLYGITRPKVVLNCPAQSAGKTSNLFRNVFDIKPDQKIFLYQGGLGYGRGIEILLDSFIRNKNDRCVIVFMGNGPLQELVQEKANEMDCIFYHSSVSQDVLLSYTSSADYGILFYEDSCLNHRFCSPNKMFEYLMAGIPVICSNLFEMKRLIETNDFGLVAKHNTVDGFCELLERSLLIDYDKVVSNVKNSNNVFNWENQESVLLEVYSSIS